MSHASPLLTPDAPLVEATVTTPPRCVNPISAPVEDDRSLVIRQLRFLSELVDRKRERRKQQEDVLALPLKKRKKQSS